MPGRFDLCANCNRQLFWGHDRTHDPFKTSDEALQDRATVTQRLQVAAVEQAEHAREQAEIQATYDRHGFIVRFSRIALIGLFIAAGLTYYMVGTVHTPELDTDTEMRWWKVIGAIACLSITSLVGLYLHPLATMSVFLIEGACLAYFGLPAWVWAIPLVAALSELFSKGVRQLLANSKDVDGPEARLEHLLAKQKQELQSHAPQEPPPQRQQSMRQPAEQAAVGPMPAERTPRLRTLTCPKCKGAIAMPSTSVPEVTCQACGGVFKTQRQKAI